MEQPTVDIVIALGSELKLNPYVRRPNYGQDYSGEYHDYDYENDPLNGEY